MVDRSVIGIAGNETHTSKGQVRCDIPYAYVRAVEDAGGTPLVLPQLRNLEALEEQLQKVQGLVLPGGGDVHPLLWGAEPERNLGATFPFLDRFQIALARKALEKKMPLLGICKGLQVLNVALEGTLLQDLSSCPEVTLQHTQSAPICYASHSVILEKGSLLEHLWGERIEVNSFHHQAVREPGKGLSVAARSPDGVIEALEMKDRPFVLGVQWHPEGMVPEDEKMYLLFRRFVKACEAFAKEGR
ncbi:MAG TPA: gamma-glutamyl-gamma-aminobutyrate hydrolase family protein [Synergistaceae bacterium]|nr:gamma-glutamyl-gamma-aminobutyrate hydrolase family protein [Synergistaceae bacterium]